MNQYADSKWKRDVDEYKGLLEIEERLRNYKRVIGTNKDMLGNKLSTNNWFLSIKGYHTEVDIYFKWLYGYIKKQEQDKKISEELKGKRLLIEAFIERSAILINEGFIKNSVNNFARAYSFCNEAEIIIKELIIAFGMGVQITKYFSQGEKNTKNIQDAIENYG